jgi:Flp pilus assembly protein TadG
MMRRLLKLRHEYTGTAAIEFAFLAPIIVAMFMGAVEISNAVIVYMKLVNAADTIADLTAQTPDNTTLHAADVTNLYTAGQLVMSPSSGTLGLALASVTFNATTGTPSVAWQQTKGGASSMTDLTSSNTTLTALGNAGDSVIVAQATYTYSSLFQFIVKTPISMTSRVYCRPRLATSIPYS